MNHTRSLIRNQKGEERSDLPPDPNFHLGSFSSSPFKEAKQSSVCLSTNHHHQESSLLPFKCDQNKQDVNQQTYKYKCVPKEKLRKFHQKSLSFFGLSSNHWNEQREKILPLDLSSPCLLVSQDPPRCPPDRKAKRLREIVLP